MNLLVANRGEIAVRIMRAAAELDIHTIAIFSEDDVIDPVDTRHILARALESVPPPPARTHKKRPCIDTW